MSDWEDDNFEDNMEVKQIEDDFKIDKEKKD